MGRIAQFQNLGRKKAYEAVAEKIREQIHARQLHVDDRLPTERDLAAQFGVSRVAVREAVRSLELAGLLTVKKGQKGGIFVASDYDRPIAASLLNLLDGGDATLEDLCEIRQLIEPHAAARAARKASDAELDAITEVIDTAAAEAAAGRAIRAHNLEFHRRLIRLAGNPILAVIGETVLELLSERIRHIVSPETSDAVLAMHRQILDALRRHDAATARRVMEEDIHAVGETLARMNRQAGETRAIPR